VSDVVIDTNVLLVADGRANHMSPSCRIGCIDRLLEVRQNERVVLDECGLILEEYRSNLRPNPQTAGAAFLLWILQRQGDPQHVDRVKITVLDATNSIFAEFPEDPALANFDLSDRKFVAVANSHPSKPPILQAADSKWLGWEPALNANGITVEFVCRNELEKIRQNKTGSQQ
jgi:hypothetical protein